jgi:hypothetical protein
MMEWKDHQENIEDITHSPPTTSFFVTIRQVLSMDLIKRRRPGLPPLAG